MKSDLERAIAFAKREGYKGAEYLGMWCEFKVYSIDVGDEILCTGMPQYITIDKNGNADLFVDSDFIITDTFF